MPSQVTPTAAICAVGSEPSTEFASKLTLYDSSRSSFQVTESQVTVCQGGTVTLHYTGAQTEENEYISAIIKDSNDNLLYYQTPKESESTDGSVDVAIPSMSDGSYELVILTEQKNAAKETNYAGYDTVTLNVISDNIAPTINRGYYRVADGRTYIALTATDAESGLNKVVTTNDASESAVYTFTGNTATQTAVFNIPGSYSTLYVVDKAGNVAQANLTQDTTPPIINSITYNEGNYIIDITDTISGIWKITNADGSVVLADYSV